MAGSQTYPGSPCPSRQTLVALLQLRPDDSHAVSVRDHLKKCERCRNILDELTDSESLNEFRIHLEKRNHLPFNDQEKQIIELIVDGFTNAVRNHPRKTLESASKQESDCTAIETPDFNSVSLGVESLGVDSESSPQGEQTSARLPDSIGPYTILRQLGKGGLGIVYLAFDPQAQRKIALKKLSIASQEHRQRLFREAQAAASLTAEEVVRLFSIEQTDSGEPYITMEYVDGKSLAERIRERSWLEPVESSDICMAVARGVQAAHDAGILHRDIKPANVLLDQAGRAKLADFGMAFLEESPQELTRTGVIVGTPAYMSPELASGIRGDARTDVYGLGCVLYECLTGVPPFQGTSAQIIRQIFDSEPVPVLKLNEQVPVPLDTICRMAMNRNPAKRYESASQFAADLAAWQNGDRLLAQPESVMHRTARWYRKNRTLSWMAGAIACLLLLATAGSLLAVKRIGDERDRVKAASLRAEDNAREASRQRTIALDTLNNLVFNVEHQLKDRPGTLEVRNSILEDALRGLQDVVGEPGKDSSSIDHSSVVAHLRMGSIEMARGKDGEAEKQFQFAREIAQRMATESGDDYQGLKDVAGALVGLGDNCRNGFDHESAAEHYRQAAELRLRVVELEPENIRNQIEYCRVLVRLATGESVLGNYEPATRIFSEALARFDRFAIEVEQDRDYRRSLAVLLSAYSSHALTVEDLPTAIMLTGRWRKITDELLEQDPDNIHYLLDLAVGWSQQSRIHLLKSEWDEAVKTAMNSSEIHEQIVELNPENSWSKSNLGIQLYFEAVANFAKGEYQRTIEACRSSLAIQNELLQENPGNNRFAVPASEAATLLSVAQVRLGRLEEAAQSIEDSLRFQKMVPEPLIEQNPLIQKAIINNQLAAGGLRFSLELISETDASRSTDLLSLQGELAGNSALLTDEARLGYAIWANMQIDNSNFDVAIRIANALMEIDSSDSPEDADAAVAYSLALFFARAAEVAATNPDVEPRPGESADVRRFHKTVVVLLDRYLDNSGLLINILADPELEHFRQSESGQVALADWNLGD